MNGYTSVFVCCRYKGNKFCVFLFASLDDIAILTHFILETPKGVLAKSADPDQMPHNVASDLGLHYFVSCSTIFQQKYLN